MFDRLEKLIGKENIELLHSKTVLVIGLGGVGGMAVETLIRNGIENIILVDNDIVDITNKNRQIIATDLTINKLKTDAFEERIKKINKNVNIIKINYFITKNNVDSLFEYKFDYLIDACDTISTKILLIEKCLEKNIKFISSMGTGNKFDITKLKIIDIKKTSYDPIAKVIRKKLKDDKIKGKVMVVSSDEMPIKTNNRTPYSYSVVPNTAGIMIADYIIKDIINIEFFN
jgi:tRNA A37 threonylcarbamoyladenosine dehydratase